VLGLYVNTTTFSWLFFFFFFLIALHWTQGLVLARQVLCHLMHNSSPLCFIYFSDRVKGRPLTAIFLPIPSCIAWIPGMYHQVWLVLWDKFLLTLSTAILLISSSEVAGIIDVSHHVWPHIQFLTHTLSGVDATTWNEKVHKLLIWVIIFPNKNFM
jgi:hypothetical protein